jgi:ribosomal protein S18 acetylase RimI-like enzyme
LALSEATVRPARPDEAGPVAALIYESANGMYDRLAGGASRAPRVIERAFAEPGNNASAEVVAVADLDGEVAAAMAAFPAEEAERRAWAFQRLTLRSIPPWRWAGSLWLYWVGGRAAPQPPNECLYIDALASDPHHRRRGAASVLLAEAERRARELGLGQLALDTSLDNRAARALYLGAGYEEVAYRAAGRGLPGFVALVKELERR